MTGNPLANTSAYPDLSQAPPADQNAQQQWQDFETVDI